MTTETIQFILEHSNDDVQKLALQAHRFPHIDMSFVLRQISGRQKIKNKVPLFYNFVDILYPVKLSLEQSSSELTARYKASLFKGNLLVDLTGGFGIDCYFLSRNFNQATYIERNSELCNIVTQNFNTLVANNIQVVNSDSVKYLTSITSVDLIYIDPARRSLSGNKVVKLSDCEPNVMELSAVLIQKANDVLIKTSPMLDISIAMEELPSINEIHIVSVENECKELLFILNKKSDKKIKIKTINIQKDNNQIFEFFKHEENQTMGYSSLELKNYLYEPNSSIMKSGAFNTIAARFNVLKLHKNTHLYTSDVLIEDFPGRIFKIDTVTGSTKQDFNRIKIQISKANIAVRNYPISVDKLRKKTGIKEGGEVYIFACKTANDTNTIIVCSKVV